MFKKYVKIFVNFLCGLIVLMGSSLYFNFSTDPIVLYSIREISSDELAKENVIEENIVPETNVINNTLSGNTIVIPGILEKNLMNDDGNNFYLDHNINGDYDGIGVPYIDHRTDFNNKKMIVYAHSSMYGEAPFQALQNYHNNKSFYESHPTITINYDGRSYNYQIFSVYVSLANDAEDEGLEYYRNIYYSDSEWEETINKYKNNSEYDTGVSVNGDDKIIILQTCSMDPNYYENYYRYNLLVMGKLIK